MSDTARPGSPSPETALFTRLPVLIARADV